MTLWAKVAHGDTGRAVPIDPLDEMRAAFVLNFAKFTEWPADSAAPARDAWVIAVVDAPGMAQALGRLAQGKTVRERPVRVVAARATESVPPCHVLYIGGSAEAAVRAALAAAGGRPVLTVGDSDLVARWGAVIRLLVLEDRMRFEVNVDAARRSRLAISSKLLGLAMVTHDLPEGGAR
jgi:hypothetical protein